MIRDADQYILIKNMILNNVEDCKKLLSYIYCIDNNYRKGAFSVFTDGIHIKVL